MSYHTAPHGSLDLPCGLCQFGHILKAYHCSLSINGCFKNVFYSWCKLVWFCIYGTMHRKTNKVFAICVRNFPTRVSSQCVLVGLLISEVVWYLTNEVGKVRKLRWSINYIHKASIIFTKLIGIIGEVIKKYQLKMNHTG